MSNKIMKKKISNNFYNLYYTKIILIDIIYLRLNYIFLRHVILLEIILEKTRVSQSFLVSFFLKEKQEQKKS